MLILRSYPHLQPYRIAHQHQQSLGQLRFLREKNHPSLRRLLLQHPLPLLSKLRLRRVEEWIA
jgi:hypothetical protein